MKWENVPFGSLYQQPSRNGLSKPSRVRGSGVKMVNMGELFAHDRIFDIPMELVPVTEKELSTSSLEQEDLLFARQSLVLEGAGKCSIVKEITEPTVFESHLIRVRLDSAKALPEFYYYYFKSPLSPIKSIVSQCAQAGIKATDLAALSVACPPLPVQKKIAESLALYDSLIENNRRQIKLLEEAAQRLYKEWFVDLRFPGHEHTPIIDGIPQGWRVVSVADLGEYINGYAFKPTDWGKQGLPIIKIKEMSSGIGDDTPRNSGDNVPSKLFINSGDILFSWSATLSVMVWSQGKGLLNQHIFKVVPKAGIADMFVVQAIASKLPEFSNLTTGATMKHIQRGKLKEVFVMLPPASVMAAFESLSKPMLQQSMLCSLRINRATEARDRLLPKLMSGEVEV